ncbi:MAG: RNA polymerase sigma factor [Thermoanaerobaculia bacterium]
MSDPAKDPAEEAELRAIMERYQEGDYSAFEELYGRFAPRLKGFFRRQLLRFGAQEDDLVQETFLQLHRSRDTYLPGRAVTPWIFAIARHVYLMDRRRRTRRISPEVGEEALESLGRESGEEALHLRLQLEAALGRIGPGRRVALLLHDLWGWTFGEIGDHLAIGEGASKLRASRARADLRKILTEREADEHGE